MKNKKMTAQEFLNMERETQKTAEEWRDFFEKETLLKEIDRMKKEVESSRADMFCLDKLKSERRKNLEYMGEITEENERLRMCIKKLRGRNIWHRIINKEID